MLLSALWGTARQQPPVKEAPPEKVDKAAKGQASQDAAAALREAIGKAAEDPSSRKEFQFFMECVSGSAMRTLRVFPDGSGIWDGRRQFRLAGEEVNSLVEAFKQADFGGMQEV